MDAEFWHERWQQNQIGFHEGQTNHFLAQHFKTHFPPKNSRVFLPLCGKTRDIAWFLAQGYSIAGAELSQLAITELFAELNVTPTTTKTGNLTHHQAPNLDIFVGNIFDLNANQLGPINTIYDRAALVALPPEIRTKYTQHLTQLTNNAPQFLITFTYDQSQMNGPPFSIPADEVQTLYEQHYTPTQLITADVKGGLKGRCPATETLWLLKAREG